jgi:peroxiredoxin
MALTPSTMSRLGSPAPDFSLPDPRRDNRSVSLDDVAGERGTLVMFLCNHCPFVKHVLDELVRIGHDYDGTGIGIVAISSNDVATHPDDAPDKMADLARKHDLRFPYLYDESQEVARAYEAACTPDFFLYDRERKLAYRGQLDASRPGNDEPNDGRDLRTALDALIAGATPDADQKPSVGCNIKWKS